MTEPIVRDDPRSPIHGRAGFREHVDPTRFPVDSMDPDEAYQLLHSKARTGLQR